MRSSLLRCQPTTTVQLSHSGNDSDRYALIENAGASAFAGIEESLGTEVTADTSPSAAARNRQPAAGSSSARGVCTKRPMLADVRVCRGRFWRRVVTSTEHVMRWSSAGAVVAAARQPCGDRNVTGLTENLKVAVDAGLSGARQRRHRASGPAGKCRAGLRLRQFTDRKRREP